MNGSIVYQVQKVFLESGIDKIGTSKHTAKRIARENINADNRAANWHLIGKELGIHSYKTADAYRAVWRNVLRFTKENFGEKNIEKITNEHVVAFLKSKVEQDVKHATFMQYAAGLEKLETTLNMYALKAGIDIKYDFSNALRGIRKEAHAKLEKFSGSRAYENPRKIIENLKNPDHKIVARLQLEAGLRIYETNKIKANQLKSNDMLEVKGGKGGKPRTVSLPADLYQKLEEKIAGSSNHTFSYNTNSYKYRLEKAAVAAGEIYKGKATHGLRWNYAQNHMTEIQRENDSYTYALSQTSDDMGHNRPDMTEHYLG